MAEVVSRGSVTLPQRVLLDTVHDGIVVIDELGTIVEANVAAETMFGFGQGELSGKLVETLMGPSDAAGHQQHIDRYLRTTEGHIIGRGRQLEARRRDGAPVWIHLAIQPFCHEGHTYFCGTMSDITARRCAEQERELALEQLASQNDTLSDLLVTRATQLARTEALLRSVLDSYPVKLVVLDQQGEVVLSNTAWRSLVATLGQRVGEGCRYAPLLRDLFEASDADAVEQSLAVILGGERGEATHELETMSPTGRRWTVVRARRFSCADSQYVLVTHQDVTEQRRAEEGLCQMQKLDAVGQLAGGVAHDFNNLLTAISYHAAFVLDGLEAASPLIAEVREIERAAERATELTSRLLSFSRQKIASVEILDLNEVVGETLPMLKRLGGRIVVRTELGPEVGNVRGDRLQLHQVLTNLVLNARDASAPGATVRVRTCTGRSGEVELRVEDAGTGMPDEVRARIFEPFFTTKSSGNGTGLGLSVVHGIVHRMGGSIEVESAPQEGSTFIVHLPRATGPATGRTIVPPLQLRSVASKTILVVEDDDTLRTAAVRTLQACRYQVMSAGDAEGALRHLADLDVAIDLMVSDVMMPGLNGVELAGKARTLRPTLPILLVTGYASDTLHDKVDDGYALLRKPFTPKQLQQKVQEAIDLVGQ